MPVKSRSKNTGRRVRFVFPSIHENKIGKVIGEEYLKTTKEFIYYIELEENQEVVIALPEYITFIVSGFSNPTKAPLTHPNEILEDMYKNI